MPTSSYYRQASLKYFFSFRELNDNHISWTVEDMNEAFSGMSALTRLDLSSNRIRTISKRAFAGLDSLRQLNLVKNAISTTTSNASSSLEQLQEL